jgi:zinc and cadmium transporter
MSSLWQAFVFSLIGGVISLIGGLLLLKNKNNAHRLALYATPFAAGALLAAAFIDLLPEAAHQGSVDIALYATLGGILLFFLLERFLRWFHHHHEHEHERGTRQSDPKVPLIVIGDTVHNFIDGIAIAAGFLVDPTTGIIVTLAVAAHEIPQEIGDFGLLLKKGVSRKNVIIINVLSALATTIAAVTFFLIGQEVTISMDWVLGLVAGFFIYVAVSDIIPSIHKTEDKVIAGPQTILLIIGVVVVGSLTTLLHQYIDGSHDSHNESETHLTEEHTDEHDEDE